MAADTLTPAERYQELFLAVQEGEVFDDSKTFVDCVPRDDPEQILRAYRRERNREGFDLAVFVGEHFDEPRPAHSGFHPHASDDLAAHIERLWDPLTHRASPRLMGSLIDVPTPYPVPGGRFRELYYWDTYFSMLGLAASGRTESVRDAVQAIASLIDRYGHMPNGNRTYYLSRSQPPMLACMVELAEACGALDGRDMLHALRREHAYWVDGAHALRPGEAHRASVAMPDGAVLQRYWDDHDSPREESYREDVATASASDRPAHEVYRDLRAGAASGWDFSSRWNDVPDDLSTIRTTQIVPVDLNALLVVLERLVARLSEADGDHESAERFAAAAADRCAAIDRWLWDDEAGAYLDHDLRTGASRPSIVGACVVPLFAGCASDEQARRTEEAVRARLLRAGGIGTSEHETGDQWDRPNGWAPLQWLAIEGFRRHHLPLGDEIAERWLATMQGVFDREHKLIEKYEIDGDDGIGGGGEYELQDGFGWSNGVTAALLAERASSR
ncbi:alpha,alpha-trehalase TreF [Agrococcus jejuensis]|uniref:Alpha,alpha-trehalase n=1 Tax=Agrococcus jejuensis TaxID=399736 RepID=A0A1G8D501_9MICO|nr:alpha,alpha-trehalase TreF [Agrococcus jejuensis]SDH52643.1 alpha,alpha-trehalase [Agrococcus jejuensis]